MIIAKTPLRISFFGGSSDIPSFYSNDEGMVISTTIDKYMYITACRTSIDGVKAVYNDIEVVKNVEDLKHDRIKNTLKHFNIKKNIEIASFSEIPTKGTGLGSSSSFTVGLIDVLLKYNSINYYNRYDVAELASKIEIEMCGDPIGKQDQYAAAFGGFNRYTFNSDRVEVSSIPIPGIELMNLKQNLMMFYTGVSRNAATILGEQAKNDNTGNIKRMVEICKSADNALKKHKIDDFGSMLHDAWTLKKTLTSSISNPIFDEIYDDCRKAGALGGKILGAGGGGYMLFYVPACRQKAVLNTALKHKLQHFNFNFCIEGSKVEYVS